MIVDAIRMTLIIATCAFAALEAAAAKPTGGSSLWATPASTPTVSCYELRVWLDALSPLLDRGQEVTVESLDFCKRVAA